MTPQSSPSWFASLASQATLALLFSCAGIAMVNLGATGRIIALLFAIAMFVFSLWMYSRTGDWVAIVFALGSVAYGIFFFTSTPDSKP